jgi:hypothetical protein
MCEQRETANVSRTFVLADTRWKCCAEPCVFKKVTSDHGELIVDS